MFSADSILYLRGQFHSREPLTACRQIKTKVNVLHLLLTRETALNHRHSATQDCHSVQPTQRQQERHADPKRSQQDYTVRRYTIISDSLISKTYGKQQPATYG